MMCQRRVANKDTPLRHTIIKKKMEPKKQKRTKCERYTRCVGYLRPIDHMNDGKREEVQDRVMFEVN